MPAVTSSAAAICLMLKYAFWVERVGVETLSGANRREFTQLERLDREERSIELRRQGPFFGAPHVS